MDYEILALLSLCNNCQPTLQHAFKHTICEWYLVGVQVSSFCVNLGGYSCITCPLFKFFLFLFEQL